MGKSMNNLARSGIPFLVMLIGGIFTLQFFQKAKNEFGKKRAEVDLRRTVAGLGLCSKQPLEKFYKEYCESDTDNWENIRGPRAEEDNQEYVRAKERRQQEREARARTLMRATMEQK